MRRFISVAVSLVSLLALTGSVDAQGTLRIGMTASDIPHSGGHPDTGFEGFRFVGYQIYEPLIAWDLTRSDRPAPLVPGLAESWEVRKADPTKWGFKRRANGRCPAEVCLQAARQREVPRREPLHGGRGRLHLGVDQEEGRAPLRHVWVRAGDASAGIAEGDQEARRPHGRDRDEHVDQLCAVPGLLHDDRLAGAVAEVQGLAEVRGPALGHGAVPPDEARAPRAARARGVQGLLESQPPAEGRQARLPPDARAHDASRRAPQRSGRLDRGAAARRHPATQERWVPDRDEYLPAQLDAHAPTRQ